MFLYSTVDDNVYTFPFLNEPIDLGEQISSLGVALAQSQQQISQILDSVGVVNDEPSVADVNAPSTDERGAEPSTAEHGRLSVAMSVSSQPDDGTLDAGFQYDSGSDITDDVFQNVQPGKN